MMNDTSIKELLPDYYDDIREMQILMDVQEGISNQAESDIQRVQDNFNVQTASEEVVTYYERFYGIGRKEGDTLRDRRFRILVRMVSQPPFTVNYLQEQLEMLGTTVVIKEYPNQYRVEIETSLSGKGEIDELPYLFKTMIPSNIEVISTNKIEIVTVANVYLERATAQAQIIKMTNDFKREYSTDGDLESGNSISSSLKVVTIT